jgi:hypothetical protein
MKFRNKKKFWYGILAHFEHWLFRNDWNSPGIQAEI